MVYCTTRITKISSNECVGDSLDTYTNNFEFLDAITCNLEFSANNMWPQGTSTVWDLSSDPRTINDALEVVPGRHHIGWESVTTTISSPANGDETFLSNDWNSVFSTVAANSGSWAGEISIIYTCPIQNASASDKSTIQSYVDVTFPASEFSIGTTLRVFCIDQYDHPGYSDGLATGASEEGVSTFADAGITDACSYDTCYVPDNDVYINQIPRFTFLNIDQGSGTQAWSYQSFSSA